MGKNTTLNRNLTPTQKYKYTTKKNTVNELSSFVPKSRFTGNRFVDTLTAVEGPSFKRPEVKKLKLTRAQLQGGSLRIKTRDGPPLPKVVNQGVAEECR